MELSHTWSSITSGSLTVAERVCAALLPVIVLAEALMLAAARCCGGGADRGGWSNGRLGYAELAALAHESGCFDVNEVEALHDLYTKLSLSVINDGLIHKEELHLALFSTASGHNIFLDRVFDLFDAKKNNVIEFEEFVRALSVFHPSTPLDAKIDFAFKLYDLRQTGYIEHDEVEQMVKAALMESGATGDVDDALVQAIVNKTFEEADADGDGRISKKEWEAFAVGHPSVLKQMTLPLLKSVTTLFPSFIFKTEVEEL